MLIFNESKYYDRLRELDMDLSNKFSELVQAQSEYVFDQDTAEDNPLAKITSDGQGDVFVKSVDKDGITGCFQDNDFDDEDDEIYFSFHEITDTRDKITLLSLMQAQLSNL